MSDCLFCRIISGELPSEMLARTDSVVAIRDINPQAPTHVLVIPVLHLATVADISNAPVALLSELFDVANEVAAAEGLAETGYRTVFNNGRDAGMLVPHLHLHVLGGAPLGPIAHASVGHG